MIVDFIDCLNCEQKVIGLLFFGRMCFTFLMVPLMYCIFGAFYMNFYSPINIINK